MGLPETWIMNRFVASFLPYVGCITIFTVLYFLVGRQQSDDTQSSYYFLLTLILWDLHFVKRIFELLFVHKFSANTVPLLEGFGTTIYYLSFAIWIAFDLFKGLVRFGPNNAIVVYICSALFLLCVVGNGISHWMLSNNDKETIPKGFLFEYVSCPHYFFEMFQWLFFFGSTLLLSSLIFFFASALTVGGFAKDRHKKFHIKFNGQNGMPLYPKSRKAIIPFIF